MDFPVPSCNPSPTAIRRLRKDLERILQEPIDGIIALPSEQNILEWHYCLKGSPGTHYEGGYYYGKLIFQPDFPWKPPAICMITPNGRFWTNVRLCLSISDYHPESWNPGWTVASILVGLHSFMNEDTFAAGTCNESPEFRRHLAANSKNWNLKNPNFVHMFPDLVDEFEGRTPLGSGFANRSRAISRYSCSAKASCSHISTLVSSIPITQQLTKNSDPNSESTILTNPTLQLLPKTNLKRTAISPLSDKIKSKKPVTNKDKFIDFIDLTKD